MTSSSASINPALTKKLLLFNNPNQRIANDAVDAAGELIRLFITEARFRASIEVRHTLITRFRIFPQGSPHCIGIVAVRL